MLLRAEELKKQIEDASYEKDLKTVENALAEMKDLRLHYTHVAIESKRLVEELKNAGYIVEMMDESLAYSFAVYKISI